MSKNCNLSVKYLKNGYLNVYALVGHYEEMNLMFKYQRWTTLSFKY